MTRLSCAAALLLVCSIFNACSKEDELWDPSIPETEEQPTSTEIRGYVFRPGLLSASDENISRLKAPEGFSVSKFADQLGKPRILAVSPEGFVYASDRDAGIVMLLKDTDNDGVADEKTQVAQIHQAHGLTVHSGKLYVAAVREVYVAGINADGSLGAPQIIINDLPDGGQHPNRTLAFGPDNKLYISVGSTCNACPESNPMNATLVQANADGSGKIIYASGLRNTIGFGWHPQSGDLWGMDHGIDWLGDDEQKEELNKITKDAHYGWPYIYGEGKYNASDPPPGDTTYSQYLAKTTLPVTLYQAYAAPMQMAFYTADMFGADYSGDAFVAMRGSWNRSKPVGYKIVRINFDNGQPASFEDFVTGFLVDDNRFHFGRLVGVAVHIDGSLLFSDDTNGVIYRVAKQ